MELKKNFWYKIDEEKPIEDNLILVCTRQGFMELVYVENGKTMKPWRYDPDDTPTLTYDKIMSWMWLDIPTITYTVEEIVEMI